MAPKPASTAGTASKAPASTTASKAPVAEKSAKKTAKKTPADGDKKKKRKIRKETYSSYIYKGEPLRLVNPATIWLMNLSSP